MKQKIRKKYSKILKIPKLALQLFASLWTPCLFPRLWIKPTHSTPPAHEPWAMLDFTLGHLKAIQTTSWVYWAQNRVLKQQDSGFQPVLTTLFYLTSVIGRERTFYSETWHYPVTKQQWGIKPLTLYHAWKIRFKTVHSLLLVWTCTLQYFHTLYLSVNGEWASWESWSGSRSCNATCPTCVGVSRRMRLCNRPAPLQGGADCPGMGHEDQPCQWEVTAAGFKGEYI